MLFVSAHTLIAKHSEWWQSLPDRAGQAVEQQRVMNAIDTSELVQKESRAKIQQDHKSYIRSQSLQLLGYRLYH